MSNRQVWVTIFLGFVLALGGLACVLTSQVSDILQSPAIASEFEIEGQFCVENALGNGAPATIEINKISGKMSSKILDLLLLAVDVE